MPLTPAQELRAIVAGLTATGLRNEDVADRLGIARPSLQRFLAQARADDGDGTVGPDARRVPSRRILATARLLMPPSSASDPTRPSP